MSPNRNIKTNQVIYYTHGKQNPIKEFIDSLNHRQQVKVLRLLQSIQLYGLDAAARHTKKLTNTPLWELRFLGQHNLRFIYFIPVQKTILLLHGFVKKSRKTPSKEVTLALTRFQEWQSR
jgi:phage-related protein